jgi:hypothetical protein
MVIALSCDARDKYNSFVERFRRDLQTEERGLNTYFARSFGRRGQAEHDDYITNLANVQSEKGIQRGAFFCKENAGLFDEVLALPAATDLAAYAASKNFVQPVDIVVCGPATPRARTQTAAVTTKAVAVVTRVKPQH